MMKISMNKALNVIESQNPWLRGLVVCWLLPPEGLHRRLRGDQDILSGLCDGWHELLEHLHFGNWVQPTYHG